MNNLLVGDTFTIPHGDLVTGVHTITITAEFPLGITLT